MSRDSENKETSITSYILVSLIVIVITYLGFPGVIPFGFWEMWSGKQPFFSGLLAAWPLFLLSAVFTAYTVLKNSNWLTVVLAFRRDDSITVLYIASGVAAITREIGLRWIVFYGGIAFYSLSNWLLFGFTGTGLIEWFHNTVGGPVTNMLSLGNLQEYLLAGKYAWAVGAAIVGTGIYYKNGSSLPGIAGFVENWFLSLFMFYLAFQYGLPVAIVVAVLNGLLSIFVVDIMTRENRSSSWFKDEPKIDWPGSPFNPQTRVSTPEPKSVVETPSSYRPNGGDVEVIIEETKVTPRYDASRFDRGDLPPTGRFNRFK